MMIMHQQQQLQDSNSLSSSKLLGNAANIAQSTTRPASAAEAEDAAAEEANDLLYKALMQHKKVEQQRATAFMSDTRTITEAMLRKQLEAQNTKLAVSASTQYATNAKYVEVNSGKHPCIKVFAGMHALSPDEVDVYASLVENCPSAQVRS